MSKLVFVLLTVVIASGCGESRQDQHSSAATAAVTDVDSTEKTEARPTSELRSAATNLAVIDGEGAYDENAIAEREAAIQELQRWCRHAVPSRLADMAAVSKQTIEESGTSVSTLQVLQGVGTAASADVGMPCSEIFAAYTILVQSGESP